MSILTWFKKKSSTGGMGPGPVEEVEEYDPVKEMRKQANRERAEYTRQKMRLDLEKARLENELMRTDMQNQIEMARLEREEILMRRRELLGGEDEEEGDPADQLWFGLLNNIFAGKAPINQNPPAAAPSAPLTSVVSLSTEQIQAKWEGLPSYVQDQARSMNDEQLRTWVINQVPNIDTASVARVVQVVRSN